MSISWIKVESLLPSSVTSSCTNRAVLEGEALESAGLDEKPESSLTSNANVAKSFKVSLLQIP